MLIAIVHDMGGARFVGDVNSYNRQSIGNHDIVITLNNSRIDLMRDGSMYLETHNSYTDLNNDPKWAFGGNDGNQICLSGKCLDVNVVNGQLSYNGEQVGDISRVHDIKRQESEIKVLNEISDFIKKR
jgi:hypothetical protein